MTVDYIYYRLPFWEMTLLGNLPTFFYFGITLLPLKKKSLANFTSIKNWIGSIIPFLAYIEVKAYFTLGRKNK